VPIPDSCSAAKCGKEHTPRFFWRGVYFDLENGSIAGEGAPDAAHASTRTTQLYDRREDRVTLDKVVKINNGVSHHEP
jgi:hypothetical protein